MSTGGVLVCSVRGRFSKRRLANPGSCCNTASQQGGWKQVVAYHDLCEHDQVPEYIEKGFHDYEASCEDQFCNLVGPDVDQTFCASFTPGTAYPYTYTNCGVSTTISAAPTKAVVRRSNVPAILVACMHAP